MHSSRMHTACSLTISCHIICMPPTTTHVPLQPHRPPTTMHAPWQPCMPFGNHAPPTNHALPPQQPCMPPGNHTCPPKNHAQPSPATMHALPQQCMPPCNHACHPSNHALPQQPYMAPPATMHTPPKTTHTPPVNRMTNRCKNITLPQTSFAGGKNIFTQCKSKVIRKNSSSIPTDCPCRRNQLIIKVGLYNIHFANVTAFVWRK